MKTDTKRPRIIKIFSKWKGKSILAGRKWGRSIFSVVIINIVRIPDRILSQFLSTRPRLGISWHIPTSPAAVVQVGSPSLAIASGIEWEPMWVRSRCRRDRAWETLVHLRRPSISKPHRVGDVSMISCLV